MQNKPVMMQWVLQRRAGIPPNFDKMEMVYEYTSYTETIQLYAFPIDKVLMFFVIWRLEGVIVKVAQLMQMPSWSAGLFNVWPNTKEVRDEIAAILKVVCEADYEKDQSFIDYWLDIGDKRMTGYQYIACYRWEQRQMDNHFSEDTKPKVIYLGNEDEEQSGNIAWLVKPSEPETPKIDPDDLPPNDEGDDSDIWNWGDKK